MPDRVRRKLTLVLFVLFAALATASVAAAANGGFTPVTPHSPNAARINTAYYFVLVFTAAIFVLVEGLLILFIVKYRSRGRGRSVDGAQVHGHTRLELIWTVAPVLILAAIATFVFVELPGIANVPPASAGPQINVTVEGHQFYWQFDYPNGTRTINDLYAPVGTVVKLTVVSDDVIHSWWIPALGGKIQAIPGRTNHTWFKADAVGTYPGQCAELCGLYHAAMAANVIVVTPQDYSNEINGKAPTDLGQSEFTGVCATCHGMNGQGGYGPNLSNNPLLIQPAGLEAIVRDGRGKMPPVGAGWTAAQMQSLVSYVKSRVYKGAASGG